MPEIQGLGNLFSISPNPYIVVDKNGIIADCNSAFTALSGYQSDELAGSEISNLLHQGSDSLSAELMKAFESERTTDGYLQVEFRVKENDAPLPAKIRVASMTGVELFLIAIDGGYPEGEIQGGSSLSEEWLERERFIRHGMMNIIGPIQAFAQILLKRNAAMDDEDRDKLELIAQAAESAIDFITELRRLTDQESGELSLKMRQGSLESLMKSVIALLTPLCNEHDVNITVECHADDTSMPMDYDALPIALTNLMRNSVYEAMKAEIHAVHVDITRDRSLITISILNGEVVLSTRALEHYFAKYSPRENGPTHSGLSLAYAYNILRAHSGEVTVRSTPQDGTTLTVIFDVQHFQE